MIKVGVAILGFGNVGQAFARYVTDPPEALPFEVSVRALADSSGAVVLGDDAELQRAILHKGSCWPLCEMLPGDPIRDISAFIRELPDVGVSILVECLPTNILTGQPGLGLLTAALEQGLSVITVDKGPLAHGFETLREATRKGGGRLGYSGTTGVSIPETIANDQVLEIRGVLNGTTNYVLTEMQKNQRPFDEALARAQADGIAEPDPSLDIQGWDTAAKILILAKALMGADARLADVSRIGISSETQSLIDVARRTGRVVRLVGRARIWQGRVRVSVAPKLIGPDSPFYSVDGASKLAVFRTASQGEVIVEGQSGRDAIAKAIVDDIRRITLELPGYHQQDEE
ncbi:MAG TPA: hypothetical protein VLM38_10835 [Blastocatellia bacterium]|nr:hypothetical protein [Blastocatellia bacterium]